MSKMTFDDIVATNRSLSRSEVHPPVLLLEGTEEEDESTEPTRNRLGAMIMVTLSSVMRFLSECSTTLFRKLNNLWNS